MTRINVMTVMTRYTELHDADASEFMAWVMRKRRRFRITGESMMPLLRPGEEVLLDPTAYHENEPEPGDIVVAQHPTISNVQIIKRIVAVLDSGACILIGDNPAESTDSRTFGAIPQNKLIGRITCRFSR